MPHFNISMLPIYEPWFKPCRYKIAYGGRGGGKSWAFALALLIKAMSGKYRILCCREYQANIRASVHQLLRDTIARHGLTPYFNVTHTEITCPSTGSQFIFKGLFQSPNEIKSLEGIDYCWVEEAQSVSKQSWDVLIPTIRKEGSEIWASFNPDLETDETYHRFILTPRDNAIVLKVNYDSNPYFPQVLREELEHCKRTDPDAYKNIWEGECRKYSDAQIFKNKFVVEDFVTPDNAVFYYGADWGFSQDPSTLVRCFMQNNVLYIDREAYAVGVELDELPNLYRTIEGIEFARIMADNSRPETIKHMRRRGFNVRAAKKWGGSVADGVAILKSFDRIVIHPRCRHTADEFRFYSYKVDKVSDEILPIIEDKWNHCLLAGNLVETRNGFVPIEDIKVGDFVLTRGGYKKVIFSGVTGYENEIFELTTAKGSKILANGRHKILTGRGFIPISSLKYNDILLRRNRKCPKLSMPMEECGEDIQTQKTEQTGSISNQKTHTYTAMFGSCITEHVKRGMSFITRMETAKTMQLKTWKRSRKKSILSAMSGLLNVLKSKLNCWTKYGLLLKNGTKAKKAKNGTLNMPKNSSLESLIYLQENAPFVEQNTNLLTDTQNSAQTNANRHGEEQKALMMLLGFASGAEKNSQQINTIQKDFAVDYVLQVTRQSSDGVPVYNLTVEDIHEFFANDILVANCIDALRYALDAYIHGRGVRK